MAADTNGLMPLLTPDSPGLDIHANDSPKIVAVSIVLILLTLIAVTLRFISRKLSRAGFWWDDWTILGAMVVSWGACICMITTTHYGFGRHIADEGSFPARLTAAYYWFKIFYIYESIYAISITLTKYSILLFYSRIFKERYFRTALWSTFALTTATFVAAETAIIVECLPIHALWDFSPGHCIDLQRFFIGSGIPNVIINFIILVLPLPMIWTLQIERNQKLALSSVFMLGSFVVVVSIVRLVVLSKLEQVDITWEYVDAGLWTSVEPAIGVCSACLPIMRSLWIRSRDSNPSHRSTTKRSTRSALSMRSTRGPEKERVSSFTSHTPLNELSAEGELPWGNHVSITANNHTRNSSGADDIALEELPTHREELSAHPNPSRPKRDHSWRPGKKTPDIPELYG